MNKEGQTRESTRKAVVETGYRKKPAQTIKWRNLGKSMPKSRRRKMRHFGSDEKEEAVMELQVHQRKRQTIYVTVTRKWLYKKSVDEVATISISSPRHRTVQTHPRPQSFLYLISVHTCFLFSGSCGFSLAYISPRSKPPCRREFFKYLKQRLSH